MILPLIARIRPRNLFTGSVLVFLAVTFYTYPGGQLAPSTRLSDHQGAAEINDLDGQNWCSVDDIVHGHWVESPPVESIEQLQQKFFHHFNRRMRCDPITVNPGQTDREAMEQRAMQIGSPTFVPRGKGCLVRQTPWRDMIKMILRMPAGVTVIGDSIGQQLIGTFENMLLQADGLVRDHSNSVWDRIIYMDPTKPETLQLLEEAGVSKKRLEVPLVTHWRTHHLGNKTDLDVGFASIENYKRAPYEPVEWFEMFHDNLRKMYGLLHDQGQDQGEEGLFTRDDVRPEDSVIIMQTGPHWTEHELGHDMSNEDALSGFKNMVDMTESRLRALPYPVNILWQTIASPHIDCQAATQFENQRDNISSPLDVNKAAPHNHDRMALMNEYLRTKFSAHRQRPSWLSNLLLPGSWTASLSHTVRLADVWPLSVKRPEAHTVPHKGDCLHYCETGVPDEWFKLCWHMIMEDEKNRDYEYRGVPASN